MICRVHVKLVLIALLQSGLLSAAARSSAFNKFAALKIFTLAVFRIDKFRQPFDDYNALIRVTAELDPDKASDRVHVTSIDATRSCISGHGCRHFGTFARARRMILAFST